MLQKADAPGKVWPDFPQLNVWVVLLICMALCCSIWSDQWCCYFLFKCTCIHRYFGYADDRLRYQRRLYTNNCARQADTVQDYTSCRTGKHRRCIPATCSSLHLIIAAAIIWFVFNYTRHGKYMYAIGGNEAAAEVAGVNVKKTKIIIYVTATALYAIAGFLLGAKSGGAGVNTGNGYELEAIAACTIGGVSVKNGWYRARSPGVIIGVLQYSSFLKTCSAVPWHRPELPVYCTGYRYSLLRLHWISVSTLREKYSGCVNCSAGNVSGRCIGKDFKMDFENPLPWMCGGGFFVMFIFRGLVEINDQRFLWTGKRFLDCLNLFLWI